MQVSVGKAIIYLHAYKHSLQQFCLVWKRIGWNFSTKFNELCRISYPIYPTEVSYLYQIKGSYFRLVCSMYMLYMISNNHQHPQGPGDEAINTLFFILS